MVSEPAMTTRSPSLMMISNGISSFSAPSSSDCESNAFGTRQGFKQRLDTHEIIEQVLLFRPFLLPCDRPFETSLSHVIQVICAAGDQHNEPRKPGQVSDESENPGRPFHEHARISIESGSNTSSLTQLKPSAPSSLRPEAFQNHRRTPYRSLHHALFGAELVCPHIQVKVKPHAKKANRRARSTDFRADSVSVS